MHVGRGDRHRRGAVRGRRQHRIGGASIPGRTTIPAAIPDGAGTLNAPVPVNDIGTITDVDVAVRIDHSSADNLDIVLRHPDGTTVSLSTDNGVLADTAGYLLGD